MTPVRKLLVLATLLALFQLVACGAPPLPGGTQELIATAVVQDEATAAPASEPAAASTVEVITAAPTADEAVAETQASPETAAPAETTQASSVTSVASTAAAAFPLTVTDGLGRELTLDAAPARIISLAPTNTEILFAIGAGEQVVGVTEFCNYPEEARSREKIGGFSANTISVEKIVALKPDLVISGDETHQPVIDALAELNIPVMALKARSFEDVYGSIKLVGQVTGHMDQAGAVVAEMQADVDAVTSRVADIPERPAVFWEVYDEPLMTAGPSTFIGQMIELAGGANIFEDVDEEYPTISAEEVVRRNPAVILGSSSQSEKLTPELLAQRPGWEAIAAVTSGRVVLIDDDLAVRAGPRLPRALEAIAAALHPDAFR